VEPAIEQRAMPVLDENLMTTTAGAAGEEGPIENSRRSLRICKIPLETKPANPLHSMYLEGEGRLSNLSQARRRSEQGAVVADTRFLRWGEQYFLSHRAIPARSYYP
jgi:hypothetical protein